MPEQGYYRFPTIHDQTVVFVSEDDLWTVPASGGTARRLTANPGQASHPAFSPDGTLLAFAGRDEGAPEIYVMPAGGGPARRLTCLGGDSWVVGWQPDGLAVIFASNAAQPFDRVHALYAVDVAGGPPRQLPTGPAVSISFGPGGGSVIGRHVTDLARWKRYRGGLTGALWIDLQGAGEWRRLIDLPGNLAQPRWIGQRIYFLSDHEGIANLYSCTPSGENLRRHTHHGEYYARQPATDGRRIVYMAGADLYLYDPVLDVVTPVPIDFRSSRTGRRRKFVDASDYLQGYSIHPEGHSLALICRGRPYTMGNWEGPVVQHGRPQGTRYRLAAWLADGRRLAVVSDAAGEEALEIHPVAAPRGDEAPLPEVPSPGAATLFSMPSIDRLAGLDVGRPIELVPAPSGDLVALSNHRHELIVVDLAARTARVLDHSRYDVMQGLAWSPDAAWLAYGFAIGHQATVIKLCRLDGGGTWQVTRPVLHDVSPAFDPAGRYLYFLSYRDFAPVYDNLHFDLNFPGGVRPYLITLRADLPSPFVPVPRPLKAPDDDESGQDWDGWEAAPDEDGFGQGPDARSGAASGPGAPAPGPSQGPRSWKIPAAQGENPGGAGAGKPQPGITIDLDGITERIVAFPVPEGRYGQVYGLKGGVLFSSYPLESWRERPEAEDDLPARGKIEIYRFDEQESETLVEDVSDFEVDLDGQTLIYRSGDRLRVLEAGKKPPEDEDDRPSRKSGWLDLRRLRVSVEPLAEWAQMYREAWRLQRDRFWTADMSGVDWLAVYQRYLPLLERVGTRAEFSDLLWEMQGELGTSHAYEMGGDYRLGPDYRQGFLGADIGYDAATGRYVVARIVRGDAWDEDACSPLARPGARARPGDVIVALDGLAVGGDVSPQELLVNRAGNEVLLALAAADGSDRRAFPVKVLRSETPARYRDWVEGLRRQVHEATGGRVGYVHIPDMGERGYAEFHRGYLLELEREGLIVDVRYNGGGLVSQLILEKLARRRLGYDVQRWAEPIPYPVESVAGPILALCNEQAGSDGDMFCHAFKLMGLGPLIGMRTWGGVVGIEIHDTLVDGGITTQPAFSTWFKDVQWGVENYGTDPDIVVEFTPQDYVAGRDPQLERAIAEMLRLLAERPPLKPDLAHRPQLPLPVLPGGGGRSV